MKKIKRLCIPVLLGAFLMTILVGAASARPNARPQEQAWRLLTVPSVACTPDTDDRDFEHWPKLVECPSGICLFVCQLDFPAAGEQAVGAVNVKRLTMYAYDNDPGATAFARGTLYKVYPPFGAQVTMAEAQTVDSAANPQAVMDTAITFNPVYRSQAPVLWLSIGASTIDVYGFYIHYTW